jgi:hypothetical protein
MVLNGIQNLQKPKCVIKGGNSHIEPTLLNILRENLTAHVQMSINIVDFKIIFM